MIAANIVRILNNTFENVGILETGEISIFMLNITENRVQNTGASALLSCSRGNTICDFLIGDLDVHHLEVNGGFILAREGTVTI